ncbi:MAG: ATP-binding protein, partial [Dolichospermum sp.]
TNERTLIATIIPPIFHAENFQSILLCNSAISHPPNYKQCLYLVGIWNSFLVDYSIRGRVSANVNFFYMYQTCIPRLTEKDEYFNEIVERAAKLICTTAEYDELAKEVGLESHKNGVTDERERGKIRAELDGIIAHLYGLTESEFSHILSTFPIVAEEVKNAALNAYREI